MLFSSRPISLVLPLTVVAVMAAWTSEGSAQVEPAASKAVRQMSDTLASAQNFSFAGTRTLDASLVPLPGPKPARFVSKVQAAVSRPDKFLFKVKGSEDARQFYFDGSKFTLLDARAKSYAGVLTKSVNIDQLLGHLQTKWGFMPPVADFIMSNPYKMLMDDVRTGRVVGTEIEGFSRSLHLAFTQDTVDWDLWISEKEHLPRKLVIVFKKRKGSPKFQFEFEEWNLKANLPAKTFEFAPPGGFKEMELVPAAKK